MRPIWKGGISFGLLYIPVKLYTGTQSSRIDLDLVRASDHCPIRYARVCKSTGEEVPWEEIAKGYKYKGGDYVILQDEDFEKANATRSKTIEIIEFIKESEIDARYFEKPYFIEPAEEAQKTYVLLREALKKSGKVGLCRFALRNRPHMGIVRADENVIMLEQVRFYDELRNPDDLDIPGKKELSKKELDLALSLINSLTETFKPEKYSDPYKKDLEEIIEAKAKKKSPKKKTAKAPKPTESDDILDKLKKSLQVMKN